MIKASKLMVAVFVAAAGLPAQASQITTTPVVVKHVLTADYLRGPALDTALSPTELAPYLSWASTSFQLNPAVRAAGIRVMYYTDPFRQNPTNAMYTNDETTYAHACDGSRIKSLSYKDMYLMDPSSPSLRALYRQHIASRSASVQWDAFFVDDANSLYDLSDTPCGYTSDSFRAASKKLIEGIHVPVIYNGLQIDKERELNMVPNVIGGMEEGCYASAVSRPKIWDKYWTQIENTEIEMTEDKKLFFCYGVDTSDAASAIDGRTYTYASFLLTYSTKWSVLWELYSTPSRFRVEPESKLVALDPLIPTPTDISGLKLLTGVYGREYRKCYIGGAAVGACAVVVNPDRQNSHDYPYSGKYQHTLALTGGGVLDGGSVSTLGSTPPDVLAPLSAVIVFR